MKSSTIRRSTLSKETMEVIENLAKEQEESGLPGEYVRPEDIEENGNGGMSQEIDLLWQNFKTNQFNTNSPAVYISIGIVIGVLATLLVMFGINSISSGKSSAQTSKSAGYGVEKVQDNDKVQAPTLEEQTGISEDVSGENADSVLDINKVENAEGANTDTSKMTKYVVKSGDTIESIIKKHYGTYSPDKAEQIMQVNNMPTLDRINIDQEILLP